MMSGDSAPLPETWVVVVGAAVVDGAWVVVVDGGAAVAGVIATVLGTLVVADVDSGIVVDVASATVVVTDDVVELATVSETLSSVVVTLVRSKTTPTGAVIFSHIGKALNLATIGRLPLPRLALAL